MKAENSLAKCLCYQIMARPYCKTSSFKCTPKFDFMKLYRRCLIDELRCKLREFQLKISKCSYELKKSTYCIVSFLCLVKKGTCLRHPVVSKVSWLTLIPCFPNLAFSSIVHFQASNAIHCQHFSIVHFSDGGGVILAVVGLLVVNSY